MVGATGFEPATSCSRSRRATKLRYAPSLSTILLYASQAYFPINFTNTHTESSATFGSPAILSTTCSR